MPSEPRVSPVPLRRSNVQPRTILSLSGTGSIPSRRPDQNGMKDDRNSKQRNGRVGKARNLSEDTSKKHRIQGTKKLAKGEVGPEASGENTLVEVRGLPESLNNTKELSKHFDRFGKIVRLSSLKSTKVKLFESFPRIS